MFIETVLDYYAHHGRHDLPWRQSADGDGNLDPYHILVSELMLQQTQVNRVLAKYAGFLELFPDVRSLAKADLGDVLRAWQGLGYNRRARFLHHSAQMIVDAYDGTFPDMISQLTTLPGVGVNTAGAILAYAWNKPAVFIETNVRTVYIHHFFADHTEIEDKALAQKITETLSCIDDYRTWYWALMDYGTHLKQTIGNLNKLSKSYTKQSRFEGSRRQIRGQVLRILAAGEQTELELIAQIPDERASDVLQALTREGLIKKRDNHYSL